jgi:ribonuclease Z
MHYYAQVLLNSTPQATPSLYIRFDSGGYLINVPEGTQRLCFEHQIRLNKLKSILFTRNNSWSAIGGLPGMLLTTEGLETNVNLTGKKMSGLVDSMTHFHK